MPFDFKKEYKELYLPKSEPELILVPPINYAAVRGRGDPNEAGGAYQQAVGLLYALSYTLKMSEKSGHVIPGAFPYVAPPLEGFWWREDGTMADCRGKAGFHWLSVIRLPDFVTEEDFSWAAAEASRKKKIDCSAAAFLTIDEGLCVQILHLGPYDDEPATVARMDAFLEEKGYVNDFSDTRLHHEIYLSDPRRADPSKWKTVIRHPVRKGL